MKIGLVAVLAVSLISSCHNPTNTPRTTTLWEPYLEWELKNESFQGNPYDLLAKARFRHTGTGKQHITEMFYAGDSIWKFRFTGTLLGMWSFETESRDPDLDGKSGKIEVKANGNDKMAGFLTHQGNRFVEPYGNASKTRPHRFMVYMDGTEYRSFAASVKDKAYHESPFFQFKDSVKFQEFLNSTENNGFETVFLHIGHPHIWTDGTDVKNGKNPRLETFEILENCIVQAHKRGMRIHIWMWGDQARLATPINFKGGINGAEDQRLQRYIASRLGPLPGWSVGYGFDLFEWAGTEETNKWASYLHDHFGWDHLIAARGIVLRGKNNINSYDGFGREGTFCTTSHGPADFEEVLEDMRADTLNPHLYEERHSYLRPGFALDMDGTRNLVWWQMMAGGLGGWYGHYPKDTKPFVDYPYPNPEQLRTARKFWENYMAQDLNPTEVDGYKTMISEDKNRMIIYAEETDRVHYGLPDYKGSLKATAIDPKKAYNEIDLGDLDSKEMTWQAPYLSDWVLVLGHF